MTVDELQVLITANTTALQKEIAKTNGVVGSLKKSADKTQKGVSSAFKTLKNGIIALGIGKVIKDSIQTGMNAVESDSLFETSLGKWSDSVRTWSEEMSNALGLNAVAMRKNTGVIFNMTSSMGVAEENALKMSKGISLLSEDMASFYNLDSSEAFNKLRAGLTGETEPLKALGILVDENTIKQVAYQQGIAETGSELTQQQKVLARYMAILQQTGNAQGDLARTIDSPANQLRMLKNQVSQLGLAFSNFLMPIISAVLPYITAFAKVVTSALNTLAKFLGFKPKGSSAKNETAKIGQNIAGVGSGLDKANGKAKKLKGTLASFDEMNVLQDNNADTGSGGATGGGGADVGALDFNLDEYDAHLDWINSKADSIAENIKNAFISVGDVISSIWNSEPIQAFVGAVTTYGQFIFDFWSTLGSNLWQNLQLTWSNIEGDVSTILTNMSTLWTTFWTDLQIGIETWGQPIIDGVAGVFNSIWQDAIDPVIQLVTGAWADFSGILLDLWNTHGQPLINNIGEFCTKIIELFQSIWDNVIDPIVTPFLETLSWLWEEHISKVVEKVGDFIGKLVNGALEIYNKFVQPILMYLIEKLAPAWAFLSSAVIGVLGSIFAVVSDVIGSIIGILGGIIDFIVGVFTGNWDKAWNGIKDIFKNIIDGLVGIFKFPINLIIDGINAFTSGLNKIKIPDWVPAVGGKAINIPRIPKLARGGIIDSPTIAMVGEAGKEAVMPLENNTGWITDLAGKITNMMGVKEESSPVHVVVKIGEDTILERIIEGIKDKEFQNNGEVFV